MHREHLQPTTGLAIVRGNGREMRADMSCQEAAELLLYASSDLRIPVPVPVPENIQVMKVVLDVAFQRLHIHLGVRNPCETSVRHDHSWI